jgi:dihydroorotase
MAVMSTIAGNNRMKLLIKNGRLIDPASGLDQTGDLAIAAGRIVSNRQRERRFHASRTIDAGGLVVAPGLVDLGGALREPGPRA